MRESESASENAEHRHARDRNGEGMFNLNVRFNRIVALFITFDLSV